jgi:hypothetical protein
VFVGPFATPALRRVGLGHLAGGDSPRGSPWNGCQPAARLIDMRFFRHKQPLTSPLGKKLRASGFNSLWDYVDRRGFTDLETFLRDVDFKSLAPIGFADFVLACAELDKQWNKAFRIMAAYELNCARLNYSEKSPSPDWIVISPVSALATAFADELPWAHQLTLEMSDYLLAHRDLFDRPFSWNDDRLIKMLPADCEP